MVVLMVVGFRGERWCRGGGQEIVGRSGSGSFDFSCVVVVICLLLLVTKAPLCETLAVHVVALRAFHCATRYVRGEWRERRGCMRSSANVG